MEATFSISNDVPHGLMRITMAGFFEVADIARFAADRDRAQRDLKTRPNDHLTLVDIRGMDIQAADSVAQFQRLLSAPSHESLRIAFVVAKSLASMQIRRAANGRSAGYFNHVDEAEAWLLAARTPQSAPRRRAG